VAGGCSLILVFSSCSQETHFNRVTVDGKFSVELPEYMQPWLGRTSEASLMYKNEELDVYTIVIDESKKELKNYKLNYSLEEYFRKTGLESRLKSIEGAIFGTPVTGQLNAGKFIRTDISGNVNKFPMQYKLAVIETDKRFYQVLSWTHADHGQDFNTDFDHMLASFSE